MPPINNTEKQRPDATAPGRFLRRKTLASGRASTAPAQRTGA